MGNQNRSGRVARVPRSGRFMLYGVGQSPLSLDGVAEGLYILNVVDGTSSSRTVQVIVQ